MNNPRRMTLRNCPNLHYQSVTIIKPSKPTKMEVKPLKILAEQFILHQRKSLRVLRESSVFNRTKRTFRTTINLLPQLSQMNCLTIQWKDPCHWLQVPLTTSQKTPTSHWSPHSRSSWLLTKLRSVRVCSSHLQRMHLQCLKKVLLVVPVTNLIKSLISLTSKRLNLQQNNNNYILKRVLVIQVPQRELRRKVQNRILINHSKT